jgi:RecA-family ATPase
MRIGGTISWPSKRKLERGYTTELTTIRTEYAEPREPVTLDQMQRAFAASTPALPLLSQQAAPTFQIDTGNAPSLDRERLAIQAMQGQDWHKAVIRLVASYVGKGLADAEIHALTQPLTLSGYTSEQTAREVQTAIDGARRKGWTPDANPTQFREMTEAEIEAVPPLMFKPWQAKDLSAIPVPEFVYSDFYARKYTSVTLAAPKVGKSMLALAEALDMATGRGFLTGVQRDPLIVVYYNAEDDQDVMDARVAALLTHYRIPQSEIEGRFYPVSGVAAEDFYMMSGDVPVINEPLFVGLEKFCEAAKSDVLIFDPLQDLSRSGETNEAFRLLGQRLRRMANKVGVALGLIHHTRKVAPGMTPSIDDMRGGGALRGTARFNRILISMTEEEAAKAGVANHRHFMRIGDMESNLAPPSSEVNQWYQKISVLTPNGHHVGAIEKWEWPDAFDGLSKMDAARVRNAIMAMPEPPLESIRSPNRWAGIVVAETLGLDISDKGQKARVASLIKGWIASGVLALETVPNTRAGREVSVVVAGPNNPLTEVDA